MHTIAVACDQLSQTPESWTYAFPLDIYQGGAGISINMNSNEVLINLALEHLLFPKGKYKVIRQMTLSINLNRPKLSTEALRLSN